MADEPIKKGENRIKKEAIVEEIRLRLDSASSIVLADYQGLTHKQIEALKKQLKTVNSSFSVTKNTLLKISLSASKNFADKIAPENLNAPTATLFISGDPIEALKILQKLAKDTGFPKIKVGVIDGAILDETSVIKLSTLPNRDTLIAQFVGTLNSPIQGLVVVLNGNIQKLVIALAQIKDQKSNLKDSGDQSAEASSASPAKTEEASDSAGVSDAIAPEPAVAEATAGQDQQAADAKIPTESTDQIKNEGGENSNN